MSNNYWYLGVVRGDSFVLLESEESASGLQVGSVLKLTASDVTTPAANRAETSMVEYEGAALMVRGIGHQGWICSAHLVDRAGPILTHLVTTFYRAKRGDEP